MRKRPLWWRKLLARLMPRRRLSIVHGDSLPEKLPAWNLVLAREDGEDWCVGMKCPCGCGAKLELLVLPGVKPRWDIVLDDGYPSLRPSVALRRGCRSHFWLRKGKVVWCE